MKTCLLPIEMQEPNCDLKKLKYWSELCIGPGKNFLMVFHEPGLQALAVVVFGVSEILHCSAHIKASRNKQPANLALRRQQQAKILLMCLRMIASATALLMVYFSKEFFKYTTAGFILTTVNFLFNCRGFLNYFCIKPLDKRTGWRAKQMVRIIFSTAAVIITGLIAFSSLAIALLSPVGLGCFSGVFISQAVFRIVRLAKLYHEASLTTRNPPSRLCVFSLFAKRSNNKNPLDSPPREECTDSVIHL